MHAIYPGLLAIGVTIIRPHQLSSNQCSLRFIKKKKINVHCEQPPYASFNIFSFRLSAIVLHLLLSSITVDSYFTCSIPHHVRSISYPILFNMKWSQKILPYSLVQTFRRSLSLVFTCLIFV